LSIFAPLIEFRQAAGESVTAHGFTVTPWSRAIVVRLPFARVVWNRPIGVDVTADNVTRRLPIGQASQVYRSPVIGVLIILAIAMTFNRFRRNHRQE